MTTRVVYLVRCEMPNCGSEHIPHGGYTAKEARTAAKANGWRRIYIAASNGTPARWADVCDQHEEAAL